MHQRSSSYSWGKKKKEQPESHHVRRFSFIWPGEAPTSLWKEQHAIVLFTVRMCRTASSRHKGQVTSASKKKRKISPALPSLSLNYRYPSIAAIKLSPLTPPTPLPTHTSPFPPNWCHPGGNWRKVTKRVLCIFRKCLPFLSMYCWKAAVGYLALTCRVCADDLGSPSFRLRIPERISS